jgi:hypothetical protein
VTEAEWDAFADPRPMVGSLSDKASDRKVRLFAVACCRRIWPFLADAPSRPAVETGERYVEGAADDRELDAAWRAGCAVAVEAREDEQPRDPRSFAALAAMHAADFQVWGGVYVMAAWEYAAQAVGADACAAAGPQPLPAPREPGVLFVSETRPTWLAAAAAERGTQAALLRDIAGNPFRSAPAVDPAWLAWNGGTVAKLAAAIYDGRRFADLPIVADALEDAGCADAAVLAHCRGGGEHVRGCWVVDLLTGRP